MSESGHCHRCGKPIHWVITMSGALMPIDPGVNQAGNVFIGKDGRARVTSKADPLRRPRGQPRMPHFATCPVQTMRTQVDVGITVGGTKLRPERPVKPPPPEPAPGLFDE